MFPTGRIEEVDEVLGREIAGGARRVRAATGPARRRVEAAGTGVQSGGDVREGGAPRVVEVERELLSGDARRR